MEVNLRILTFRAFQWSLKRYGVGRNEQTMGTVSGLISKNHETRQPEC